MLFTTPLTATYFLFLAFAVGLLTGSFINCSAWRAVNGESITKGRSHCTSCNHVLGFFDLIPLFSYIFLHGKCRYCGVKIPIRYPASELVCALCAVLILLKYDVTPTAAKLFILSALLLAVTLTDLDKQLIPDRYIIAGIAVFLLFAFLDFEHILQNLINGVIGGFSISLPLLVVSLLADKLLKKESMGGGDIKLFFMLGLFFDWKYNLFTLLISCITALIFALITKNRHNKIPFGPFISLGTVITMLTGDYIINAYLTAF